MKYLRLLLLRQHSLPSGVEQKDVVLNAVWGHVFPNALLVPGKTSSSIILLSIENNNKKKGCSCSHLKNQRTLALKECGSDKAYGDVGMLPTLKGPKL